MLKLVAEKLTLPDRYTVSEEAKLSRGLILSGSKHLETVSDPTQQAEAAESGRQLQSAIKDVHEARMSLSRPLVEAVDKLIALEREYCAPLIAEKERLGQLITAYQIQEKARVEAEERQRLAELHRLATVEAESNKVGTLQAELVAHNANEARQELIRAPLPAMEKAKGAVTKKKLCYEIIDIHALYKARPDLCVIKEKPSAIQFCCCATTKLPGIEFWEEEVTHFRT